VVRKKGQGEEVEYEEKPEQECKLNATTRLLHSHERNKPEGQAASGSNGSGSSNSSGSSGRCSADYPLEVELKSIQAAAEEGASSPECSWSDLISLRGPYFEQMRLGVGLNVLGQLSGVNAIVIFAPSIFEECGYSNKQASQISTVAVGTVLLLLTHHAPHTVHHTHTTHHTRYTIHYSLYTLHYTQYSP
jgi:hypothetical protein